MDAGAAMAQTGKTVFIDVITENTGTVPFSDNRRVLSVQLLDDGKHELFYADSDEGARSLFGASLRINMVYSRGYTFTGYEVRKQELPALKRFLNISIPAYMSVDVAESEAITRLREKSKKPLPTFEEICREVGVSLEYRRGMDEKVEGVKKRPEVLTKADSAAQQLSTSNGWTLEVARQYALEKIATGTGVAESYAEFVGKRGSQETIFYRYAAGQVACEQALLQALQNTTRPES